jgi:hypothetical protein
VTAARGSRLAALGLLLLATAPAGAGAHDLPTTIVGLRSGSRRCAPAAEVTGVPRHRARATFTCIDGDPSCDQDGIDDGRCELWVRFCPNAGAGRCTPRPIREVAVDGRPAGAQLNVAARILAAAPLPNAARGECSMTTSVVVPVGRRKAGLRLALGTTDAAGKRGRTQVRLGCVSPAVASGRRRASFDAIQRDIFARSCATRACHDSGTRAGGLMLVGPSVYDALVGHASNAGPGRKPRVARGDPRGSFLMDKLWGTLGPGEGEPMPLGGDALGAAQLSAISHWIAAGAPRKDTVVSRAIDPEPQPRDAPPPAPEGGFQVPTTATPLDGRSERTLCEFVRLPNAADAFVSRWSLTMFGGGHHFDVFRAPCDDGDGDGVDDCDEPDFDARYPTGPYDCGTEAVATLPPLVTSQRQQVVYKAGPGLGWFIRRRQPVILNWHFLNRYRDTMAAAWATATVVDPDQVRYRIESMIEARAEETLRVAPGQVSWVRGHACAFASCDETPPAASHFVVLGFASHSHWRSRRVVVDLFGADGTPVPPAEPVVDAEDGTTHLYVSADYSHPVIYRPTAPLVVEAGEQLRYGCAYDNGVRRAVKLGCEEERGVVPGLSQLEALAAGRGRFGGRAKSCRTDADCRGAGTGRCVPANLVFGSESDDAMCGLLGDYYPCPGGPPDCPAGGGRP